jgi:hypothetical protein
MIVGYLKKHKVYIFPLTLLILLLTFTILRINGSSISYFNTILFKGSQKNSGLILGHPQTIRSDEWEVNTPLTVAQTKSGFPMVNKDIGNGEDMAVVGDVPYKDWSESFKPQNWSFFVLPLEYAFAFKWWLIGIILMLSCYLFCLQLLPKKYLLSSLVSIALFLSPFVQWWYQSTTVLSLAYGLLITFIVMRILDKSLNNQQRLWWSAGLAYLGTSFALILYPPFILPVALATAFFLAGHLLNLWREKSGRKHILKSFAYAAVAAFISIIIFAVFLKSHSHAIKAIQNSVYPGRRIETSGGFSVLQLGGGYYNLQLQSNNLAAHLPSPLNQSEASNFILIFPFLVPGLIYVSLLKAKGKRMLDWRIVLLLALVSVFLIRLFVPFSEFIFNFLKLNTIPHTRLLIGMGLVNIMLITLIIEKLQSVNSKLNSVLVWASTALAFVCTSLIGIFLRSSYKGYLSNSLKIIFISIVIASIVLLILKSKGVPAMIILVVFSFVSAARINPLYHGLSPLVHSKLSSSLQQVGDQKGRWVVSDDVIFENVIFANGLRALSGTYSYPQLSLWEPLGADKQTEDVYNRFAHVFFSVENIPVSKSNSGAYLDPPATDAFRIHADPCASYMRQEDVKYIFTSKDESSLSCLKEIKTIKYPAVTYRVYEVQ